MDLSCIGNLNIRLCDVHTCTMYNHIQHTGIILYWMYDNMILYVLLHLVC